MTRHLRLMITGLSAAAVLAAAVGSASARNISLSNQTFLATWASLDITTTITPETIRCLLTLEGSFHSGSIAKVLNRLVGYVTRAAVDSGCIFTILTETLPWHVTYNGFTGTLPTIATIRINIIRFAFLVRLAGIYCLAATTAAQPLGGIINIVGRVADSLTVDRTRNIPLREPFGGSCGFAPIRFGGTTSRLSVLNSGAGITVTLI